MSNSSLAARPHPAQYGEDEAGEGDQCSQAAVNDGEIAVVMVGRDWDRFKAGGCQIHGCVVAIGSRAALEDREEVKIFGIEMIEIMAENRLELLLK